MKNILKFLRSTKDAFLIFYRGSELKLEEYFDSSFQLDLDDSKFLSGYEFILKSITVT